MSLVGAGWRAILGALAAVLLCSAVPAQAAPPGQDTSLPGATELFAQGIAEANSGELERASEDLDQALRLNPDYFPAHVARAEVRLLTDDVTGALDDYAEATRVEP